MDPVWTRLCLLLVLQGTAGQTLQCRVSPVGALHPVQAQLDTWGAGPGCAAMETGTKETHVVALGTATHSPDIQNQEVRGCLPSAGTSQPEVHVVRLMSAGSGLCGSLQVEVSVSVLPPVASAGWCRLVLILKSEVPVNWALTASRLKGHITVYSSNSVSPLHPEEAGLTLSRRMTSDLSSTSDLLAWANQTGFPLVSSYTEAGLANHFVIQVREGGIDEPGWPPPRLPWVQERRLRLGLAGGGASAGGGNNQGWEAISVQCQDGRLNVAVDKHVLQDMSLSEALVTLWDPRCWASSNNSHFLLTYPVISCGTEGLIEKEPRGVTYRNRVLLWRQQPTTMKHNETERWTPLAVQFSCFAAAPAPLLTPTPPPPSHQPLPQPWGPWRPLSGAGPLLSLQLSVTESHNSQLVGPCTVSTEQRVYVEVTAQGGGEGVEVRSCEVSPLSHPLASSTWKIITDGCSSDTSLTLSSLGEEKEEEEEEEGEEEGEEEEDRGGWLLTPDRDLPLRQLRDRGRERRRGGIGGEEREEREMGEEERREREMGEEERREREMGEEEREEREMGEEERREREMGEEERREREMGEEERKEREMGRQKIHRLRFSFILRPVYINSVQFLHCKLHVCSPLSGQQGAGSTSSQPACQGALLIPALVPTQPHQQCVTRYLYRPMLVTHLLGGARPVAPPPGKKKQPSLPLWAPPQTSSELDSAGSDPGVHTGLVLVIVFTAFLMGSGLTGALWCIYTHTGSPTPIRRGSLLNMSEHSTWSSAAQLEHSREV